MSKLGERIFSINTDLYGTITCEYGACDIQTSFILMTSEEYKLANDKDLTTNYVFEKQIGTALCEKHMHESTQ